MHAPAQRDHQSPLEAAMVDVQLTLTELLAAADEQYAAVAERDRTRIEDVTRVQERLSARLERAERLRVAALEGSPIQAVIASEARLTRLSDAIASAVRDLQAKNARNASLIQRSAELNAQSIQFLQRLVSAEAPAYGTRGQAPARHSVLVDSRA
jgi:flagellar biosynthesis/type III secretory pathway chaperone